MAKAKLIRLNSVVSVRNLYRVQKKQWAKWSPGARLVFNALFSQMKDQKVFTHPKAPQLPAKVWYTTRWNAAWSAASEFDDAHRVLAKAAQKRYAKIDRRKVTELKRTA